MNTNTIYENTTLGLKGTLLDSWRSSDSQKWRPVFSPSQREERRWRRREGYQAMQAVVHCTSKNHISIYI